MDEQLIVVLREVDAGANVQQVCRRNGIAAQAHCCLTLTAFTT